METEIDFSVETQVTDLLDTAVTPKPNLSLGTVPERFAKRFRKRSQAAIERETARVRARIEQLGPSHKAALSALLPLEVVAARQLKARQARELYRLQDAVAVLTRETEFAHLSEQYDRLDMSFLSETTWSREHHCQLPLFAVFDLENPICSVSVQYDYLLQIREYQEPEESPMTWIAVTPESVRNYFNTDGLQALAQTALTAAVKKHPQPQPDFDSGLGKARGHDDLRGSASVKARADFAGLIPDVVREIICDAKPHFDQILLVAATSNWSISSEAYVQPQPAMIPVGDDPLVVGRRDRSFWLITAFDTTPAEDFVRREYLA